MSQPKIGYIALGSLSKALNVQTTCYYGMVCDMCKAAYSNDMQLKRHNPICPACHTSSLRHVTKEEYDLLAKGNWQ